MMTQNMTPDQGEKVKKIWNLVQTIITLIVGFITGGAASTFLLGHV